MKEGRKEKGREITEGFNPMKPGFSQKKLSQLVIEANRKREERRVRSLAALQERKDAIREKLELESAEAEVRAEVEAEKGALKDLGDDGKSAKRMLDDLRYAYRHTVGNDGLKGRQRLTELMKNDSEFKYFVKELMKIEVALMTAEAKKPNAAGTNIGGQQNFFVVLKGLEVAEVGGSADNTVDMRQIQNILDPEHRVYEQDSAKSNQDAPDMLLGRSLEGAG